MTTKTTTAASHRNVSRLIACVIWNYLYLFGTLTMLSTRRTYAFQQHTPSFLQQQQQYPFKKTRKSMMLFPILPQQRPTQSTLPRATMKSPSSSTTTTRTTLMSNFFTDDAVPSQPPTFVLLFVLQQVVLLLLTYLGWILLMDRPRGQLMLPQDRSRTIDVEVRPSPVAGQGLFVTRPFPAGTCLGTYPGALVPLSMNLPKVQAFPICEVYIWRFSDSRYLIDPTNSQGLLEDDYAVGGNPSFWGSCALWDRLSKVWKVSNVLCRINEPPLGKDVNVVTVEDLEKRVVTLVLERDVEAGEELFLDYGIGYDRSRYGSATSSEEKVL